MSILRVGLIGLGRGLGILRIGVQAFEDVEPAGVCDLDPGRLEKFGEEFPDVPRYTDFDRMLEEVPMDILIVATPAHLHAEFSIKALERDINVLSEIPCAHTLEEAWALWEAHKKSNAMYMTGANANMKGFIQTALDLKKKGLFGEPYYCEAAYYHDLREYFEKTPWRRTQKPIYYCTHSLGPLLCLIEEDLEWVSCFDTKSHINKQPDEHDAMTALFRTKSNVVVHLLTTFIHKSPIDYQHQYRFFTTKGAFERTLRYPTFKATDRASARGRTLFYSDELYGYRNWIELPIDGYTRPEYEDKKEYGHSGLDYVMWDLFLKALKTGGPSPVSLREGLRMTLPGVFAAASAEAGGELTKIVYPWTADKPPGLKIEGQVEGEMKECSIGRFGRSGIK